MYVPTSFLTLEPGTRVVDRFGRPAGEVRRVLLHEDGGFDGIIVRTGAGKRFVDAPEVRRISRGAVTLGITIDELEVPSIDHRGRDGAPAARNDRTDVTEADRDAVINLLKRAYVRDELTTEELGERVAIAHLAETLDRLDVVLQDLEGD
jgi:Domain of unknown function (DUF1707)